MIQWPVGQLADLSICKIRMTSNLCLYNDIITLKKVSILTCTMILYLLETGAGFCSGWLGTRDYSVTLYWSFYWTSSSFKNCIMLSGYTFTKSSGNSLPLPFFSCLNKICSSALVICMNKVMFKVQFIILNNKVQHRNMFFNQ